MEAFINVIKKHSKVQNKINDMLDRYNWLPYNYQSVIGYDALIENVFLIKIDKYNGYYNN